MKPHQSNGVFSVYHGQTRLGRIKLSYDAYSAFDRREKPLGTVMTLRDAVRLFHNPIPLPQRKRIAPPLKGGAKY